MIRSRIVPRSRKTPSCSQHHCRRKAFSPATRIRANYQRTDFTLEFRFSEQNQLYYGGPLVVLREHIRDDPWALRWKTKDRSNLRTCHSEERRDEESAVFLGAALQIPPPRLRSGLDLRSRHEPLGMTTIE